LTSITIPKSISFIGTKAFYSCSSLERIDVDEENDDYQSVDGVLYDKSLTNLIQCPGGKAGSVFVSESVTEIDDGAFYPCSKLTRIDVNESNREFQSVDGVLFDKEATKLLQCPGGKEGHLIIPDSVENIAEKALDSCEKLTLISIGAGAKYINENELFTCSNLEYINVSANNKYYASFDGLLLNKEGTELISAPRCISGCVTIPENVTTILEKAFSHCAKVTSITFESATLEDIGNHAFEYCSNLQAVKFFGEDQPSTCYIDLFEECPDSMQVCVTTNYTKKRFCAHDVVTNFTLCDVSCELPGSNSDSNSNSNSNSNSHSSQGSQSNTGSKTSSHTGSSTASSSAKKNQVADDPSSSTFVLPSIPVLVLILSVLITFIAL